MLAPSSRSVMQPVDGADDPNALSSTPPTQQAKAVPQPGAPALAPTAPSVQPIGAGMRTMPSATPNTPVPDAAPMGDSFALPPMPSTPSVPAAQAPLTPAAPSTNQIGMTSPMLQYDNPDPGVNDAPPGPSNVQPLAASPTPAATGPSAPPAPPSTGGSALPAGYTQGQGADAGSIYFNGQKIEGIDNTTGQAILSGGQRGANIQDALTALQPGIDKSQKTAMDAAQLAAGQGSSNKAIQALYNDPAYLAAREAGDGIGADGSLIDKSGATVQAANPALAALTATANSQHEKYVPPADQTTATRYLQNGQLLGPDGKPLDGSAANAANAGGLSTGTSTPTGGRPSIPTSAHDIASLIGGGAGRVAPAGTPVASSPSPTSGTGGAASAPMSTGNSILDALLHGDQTANSGATGGPSLTNTDPNNPLTAKTIGVGALNDPVQMALSAYNTFRQSTDPQYQADLRDANRTAAAAGAIGSGQLNTSLGNIANTRQNTLATKEQELLNGALGTQNDNAYRNVGIAQQQQGFQNEQQQQGFNNALQQALYGSQGDPSQLGLALSAIFGQQANSAGQNLGSLISGSTQNNTTSQILQQILGGLSGGGGGQAPLDPATQQILDSLIQGGVPGVQTTGSY